MSFKQIVEKPTHDNRTIIDYVYITNSMNIVTDVSDCYYSDLDYVLCMLAKIMKCSSFPTRCDSLQNIEISLLTVPLVVICELVSKCLPTSWFSKLCLLFKNWIYSQASYRFVQFLTVDIKYNI